MKMLLPEQRNHTSDFGETNPILPQAPETKTHLSAALSTFGKAQFPIPDRTPPRMAGDRRCARKTTGLQKHVPCAKKKRRMPDRANSMRTLLLSAPRHWAYVRGSDRISQVAPSCVRPFRCDVIERMKTTRRSFVLKAALPAAFAGLPLASRGARPSGRSEYIAYIGTYTSGKSKGIYAYRFDSGTGKLSPIGLVAESASPSFLAVAPKNKCLYAVKEVSSFNGKKAGAVSSF